MELFRINRGIGFDVTSTRIGFDFDVLAVLREWGGEGEKKKNDAGSWNPTNVSEGW
jgi:hypothetical protein